MKHLFLTAALWAAAAAQAQQPRPADAPWTLDECIRHAQQHNIEVQQRALNVEQRDIELSTARYSRLPDLNASVGYNASFGRGTSADNIRRTETLQTGSLDVAASMPLFEGLRINRRIKGSKLDLAAAAEDLERLREDVAVNIMTRYLEVLYNKELVGIAERQLALSRRQALRSDELVKAGKQPESALYESRALEANDFLALTQARNDLNLALLDLSQALNRENAAGFDIATPRLDSVSLASLRKPGSTEAVYDYAAANRPHIRAERLRLESTENAVRIARAGLYPTLSLRGGFGTGVYSTLNTDFWTQFDKNRNEFVGLSLGIPIFNRRTTRNNIRTAKLSVRNQQLTLLNAEQTLRKEIEQAWVNADAAYAKYGAAEKALAAARVAFAYEERKAEAGRSTLYDFNDAKTRMQKAESELAQARYEFVFRQKILDYYRGEELTLETN
ncbi:MAG: TolC family protein [Alistipes sp.]|nr:TolC family protein [Alistipes sp.]